MFAPPKRNTDTKYYTGSVEEMAKAIEMCIRDRSYLTPDRTKPITARKLCDDFDRAAVFAVLEQNAARATEKAAAIPEYPDVYKRQHRALSGRGRERLSVQVRVWLCGKHRTEYFGSGRADRAPCSVHP